MSVKKVPKKELRFMRWAMLLIATLFYFYEYYLRVTPSIIVPELMKTFQVGAAAVGVISAFYFYAYAPMQFVVGPLMDRYGARKLLLLASILCGTGGIFFSISHYIFIAEISRFFLGIGSAFGFVAVIYVATHWFPKNRWSIIIGIANSIGMFGSVIGEGPLSFAVEEWGWRSTVFAISLLGFAIALLIILLFRNQSQNSLSAAETTRNKIGMLKSLWIVIKIPKAWKIAVASAGFYAILPGFASLWAPPYLQVTNGFSIETAGFASSMIFLGVIVGGPIIGHISDRLEKRQSILLICIALTFLLFSAFLYLSPLSTVWVFALLFLTGFFNSAQLLTYTFAIDSMPMEVKGTSAAFVNAIIFIFASLLQTFVGVLLNLSWGGKVANGLPIYSIMDYKIALTLFPLLFLLSFYLTYKTKDRPKKIQMSKRFIKRLTKRAKQVAKIRKAG